ncbi:MAG: hypothetical protein JWM80_1854 [Cyanobacteria bacterium RYN_339]|nr:hypothetical protein [Cyanobacteria bacterium RYN_339]
MEITSVRPVIAGQVPQARAVARTAAPGDRFTGSPEALAASVVASWRSLKAATATSEVLAYKDGQLVRSQTIDATYEAPGCCTVAIKAGHGKGAKLEWDGGETVTVHKGPLTFHWPLTNDKLVNPHGWTLHDTGPGMVIRMLAAPGTKVKTAGSEGGLPVLDVVSPASPAGVTREQLVIDPARRLVTERRLYAGDALLGSMSIKAFAATGS